MNSYILNVSPTDANNILNYIKENNANCKIINECSFDQNVMLAATMNEALELTLKLKFDIPYFMNFSKTSKSLRTI